MFAECPGTETGKQDVLASQPHLRIPTYRTMYENCTTVRKNLELVQVRGGGGDDSDEELDLSFLENIREVHGYVLVVLSFVARIPLTSLRVIRGRRLFGDEGVHAAYSLYVAHNGVNASTGLRRLEMPSLVGQSTRLCCTSINQSINLVKIKAP